MFKHLLQFVPNSFTNAVAYVVNIKTDVLMSCMLSVHFLYRLTDTVFNIIYLLLLLIIINSIVIIIPLYLFRVFFIIKMLCLELYLKG